jgi:hypothetical protein
MVSVSLVLFCFAYESLLYLRVAYLLATIMGKTHVAVPAGDVYFASCS